ncbi:MAG TPA: matrixin family metalloprotease [Actinomycetota bacterium]|nr:matrixin family metalloprotease [Actinomycetota bacterium]
MTLVILAATAARVVASVGPDVATGSVDPRGFKFTRIDRSTGEPVRFDPCAPIHYVINPASAPAGGIDDVHATFEKTTEASGVKFVYDGTTEEVPSVDRETYQPDRYGDRWAPLLIAWVHELPSISDQPEVDGRERIGVGGSALVEGPDGGALVTGMAIFDADADLQPGFGGSTWGQAMLHEVGHIMGLDHVEIPNSIMNPLLGLRSAAWGEGDRAGLWELGLGSSCIRTPQPH